MAHTTCEPLKTIPICLRYLQIIVQAPTLNKIVLVQGRSLNNVCIKQFIMSFRNFVFEKDQPFHIVSRAVEERKIFANKEDCCRFVFQIYAANIGKPAPNFRRTDVVRTANAILKGGEVSQSCIIKEHSPLVHIIDFSLNVTHYHFYLISTFENSVSTFMQKLNGGFAMYFNLKYNRKGSLFGSRYKSVTIENDFQSDAVSRYISIVNPLDIYQPKWREDGLTNKSRAMEFLRNYEFSSFPDRIGIRSSKILAPADISSRYISGLAYKENYIRFAESFLNERKRNVLLPKETLLEQCRVRCPPALFKVGA